MTVLLAGDGLSEKSGMATTRVTVAVRVSVPPTPVIVSVYEPAGVTEEVETDKVDVEVVGFGEKVAEAPVGSPLTLNATWLLNPTRGFIATA